MPKAHFPADQNQKPRPTLRKTATLKPVRPEPCEMLMVTHGNGHSEPLSTLWWFILDSYKPPCSILSPRSDVSR